MRAVACGAALLALLSAGYTPGAWAPRQYPISFWCGPPAGFITRERFRQIAAAGFQYVMPPCEGPASVEGNRTILECARGAGIKAFLSDSRMPTRMTGVPDARQRLDAIVQDYSRSPSLAGYFLTDEPSAKNFAGLAEVVSYLRLRDPFHPAYINLFPNYASPEQLGAPTYADYVRGFVQTVRPFAVSYDHYHFMVSGDRPGFVQNLDTVREISSQCRLPFWQIILALPHPGYRQPSEAEKRWDAMQTLAYGGQGLMYFTYWTPSGPDFRQGSGIIARDGTATPQYEEVQRINADVHAIGQYLLGSAPVAVFQNGTIPPGGHPREPGTPVSFRGGGDVTVGLFRNDTHLYALFANGHYQGPARAEALLSTAGRPVQRLEKRTGTWTGVSGIRTEDGDFALEVALASGDGELYRW